MGKQLIRLENYAFHYKKPYIGTYGRSKLIIYKKKKTQLCEFGKYCSRVQCAFAHSFETLRRKRNKYNSNFRYKEFRCENRRCNGDDCDDYHHRNERRVKILQQNFSQILANNNQEYNYILDLTKNSIVTMEEEEVYKGEKENDLIVKRSINFSQLIPPLSILTDKELSKLMSSIVSVVSKLNVEKKLQHLTSTPEPQNINQNLVVKMKDSNVKMKQSNYQDQILKVILSLSQTKSLVQNEFKYAFLNLLSQIPIIDFRYKLFSYEKNSFKGQFSYSIRTETVVPFVCEDILRNKPRQLKLNIILPNKDEQPYQDLMGAVQQCGGSIHKLEICSSEFILPINMLFSLKNIKVIHLTFKFNHTKDSENERECVDATLGLLLNLLLQNPNLKIQVSMFNLVIDYEKNNLEIYNERTDRRKYAKRRTVNRMFNHPSLLQYYLTKFSETFAPIKIKYLTIDFSNMFVSGESNESMSLYTKCIQKVLLGLENILSKIEDNSIEKLRMRFFNFLFNQENQDKKKLLYQKFLMNFELIYLNNAVVSIQGFFQFSENLKKKLIYKFKHLSLEGNLFYQHGSSIPSRKALTYLAIKNAEHFQDIMTNKFSDVWRVKAFQEDEQHLANTLCRKVNTIPYIIFQKDNNGMLYGCKNLLKKQLKRKQLISVLTKYAKIRAKNNSFILRKDILKEIFNLIQLSLPL